MQLFKNNRERFVVVISYARLADGQEYQYLEGEYFSLS
jgi:hypothetical protein